jgi:enamine deaminase RidA (YjgF/YER057c/UK114 family)
VTRQNVSSGGKWESTFGYSRAVRVGNQIAVSGTTAAGPDGSIEHPNDAYEQTKRVLEIIETALREAGAAMSDVVRTRIFVTDISQQAEVGRAHAEFFADVRPVATMVEIQALLTPDMVVEIEVDAVVSG